METSLERGNCRLCSQRRVLGCLLQAESGQEQEFRCCACIDEHGVSPRASAEAMNEEEADPPRNWWASIEPPASLMDVPAGFVEVERVPVRGAGRQDWFLSVTDPAHNYFSGHGAERVWPAAFGLAGYMLSRPCHGLHVVELGAGCGIPGIAMARHGATVTLTDVPWLLPLASYNVEANFAPEDGLRPSVAPLRWGSSADVGALLAEHGTPDLVVGSDLIYREEDFEPLLHSIAALGAREVLLSVVQRDGAVRDFLKRLELLSWEAELCGSSPAPLRNGDLLLLRLHAPATPADVAPAGVRAGLLAAKGPGVGGEDEAPGGAGTIHGRRPSDREAYQAAVAQDARRGAGGCWGAAPVA